MNTSVPTVWFYAFFLLLVTSQIQRIFLLRSIRRSKPLVYEAIGEPEFLGGWHTFLMRLLRAPVKKRLSCGELMQSYAMLSTWLAEFLFVAVTLVSTFR